MIKKNAIHIGNSKQGLNHGLALKKVHIVIKFNQKGWLKPYLQQKEKKETNWCQNQIIIQHNFSLKVY